MYDFVYIYAYEFLYCLDMSTCLKNNSTYQLLLKVSNLHESYFLNYNCITENVVWIPIIKFRSNKYLHNLPNDVEI